MAAALWITTREILLGFVLAILTGFVLELLVGETIIGEKAVMPYLVVLNTMPKVAFGPLFVIIETTAGIHAADANSRMLFRSIRASGWQTLVQLKLPVGLPQQRVIFWHRETSQAIDS